MMKYIVLVGTVSALKMNNDMDLDGSASPSTPRIGTTTREPTAPFGFGKYKDPFADLMPEGDIVVDELYPDGRNPRDGTDPQEGSYNYVPYDNYPTFFETFENIDPFHEIRANTAPPGHEENRQRLMAQLFDSVFHPRTYEFLGPPPAVPASAFADLPFLTSTSSSSSSDNRTNTNAEMMQEPNSNQTSNQRDLKEDTSGEPDRQRRRLVTLLQASNKRSPEEDAPGQPSTQRRRTHFMLNRDRDLMP